MGDVQSILRRMIIAYKFVAVNLPEIFMFYLTTLLVAQVISTLLICRIAERTGHSLIGGETPASLGATEISHDNPQKSMCYLRISNGTPPLKSRVYLLEVTRSIW
jgi:hypothetical protein